MSFMTRAKDLLGNVKAKVVSATEKIVAAVAAPLATLAAVSQIAPPASAASFDINETVGPILQGVSALIPDIVNLIVAVVPAIIVLAVVGFIVAFLDKILSMLKLR